MLLKKVEFIIFPKGSRRRLIVKKLLVKSKLKSPFDPDNHDIWMKQQQKNLARESSSCLNSNKIKFSVVIPVYNTPIVYLNETVYSIVGQTYSNWELILVDASTDKKTKKTTHEFTQVDSRIKVISCENKGIAHNTNIGIKASSGDYIAFCDHDDVLDYEALAEIALKIKKEKSDIVYTDEDKISDDSRIYLDPFFKPNWSPDLFTHVNYFNHLTVVSKELVDKVGPLNSALDGAQDYDFYLRAISKSKKISHVSKVLYHWRLTKTSTAQDFSSKKNILTSGQSALSKYFKDQNISVTAKAKTSRPGFYNLHFNNNRSVSIVLLPIYGGLVDNLFFEKFVSKTKLNSSNSEFIVPSNDLNGKYMNVRTVHQTDDLNRYLINVINSAKNENIILINSFLFPEKDSWADEITGYLDIQRVSAVAPMVLRNTGIIDSCGMIKDNLGNYAHLFRSKTLTHITNTPYGDVDWVRNVDAFDSGILCARKDELLDFINQSSCKVDNLIFEFTKNSSGSKVLNPEIKFYNLGFIKYTPTYDDGLANGTLIVENGGFEVKTNEKMTLSILQDLN